MAVMMAGLQDLAWLRMNAALRHEVPSFKWATVHTSSPGLTIILEGDESLQPRQVSANAVGPLTAGQRVRVELQGTRITVTAAQMSGFLMPNGDVDILSPMGTSLHLGTSAQLRSSSSVHDSRIVFWPTGQATMYGPGGFLNFRTDNGVELRGQGDSGLTFASNGGAVYLTSGPAVSRIYLSAGADTNDSVYIRNGGTNRIIMGASGANARMNFYNPITTSNAGNVYMDPSSGWISRSTSVAAGKAAIEDLTVDEDAYLQLRPRDWFDKASADRYADYLSGTGDVELESVQPLMRIPGLVAEEVAESGNEWLVQRDDEGALSNVYYERGWVPAIPIIKRLREQVQEQETRIADLESKVDHLLQLLDKGGLTDG